MNYSHRFPQFPINVALFTVWHRCRSPYLPLLLVRGPGLRSRAVRLSDVQQVDRFAPMLGDVAQDLLWSDPTNDAWMGSMPHVFFIGCLGRIGFLASPTKMEKMETRMRGNYHLSNLSKHVSISWEYYSGVSSSCSWGWMADKTMKHGDILNT